MPKFKCVVRIIDTCEKEIEANDYDDAYSKMQEMTNDQWRWHSNGGDYIDSYEAHEVPSTTLSKDIK